MSNESVKEQKQEVQVGSDGVERTRASRVYSPQVDIFTAEDEIVLLANMPGVDENSIDITLDKDVLTIVGYVSSPNREGYKLVSSEYGEGDFQRHFTIPDEIDRDNIEATVKNGVMRLTLPVAPEAKARKITVRAG